MRFSDAPLGYWRDRARKVGAVNGDGIDLAIDAFIIATPEPLLGLISQDYRPIPSGLELGGLRSLAVELFGRRPTYDQFAPRFVQISDNHLHGGLAYDRRSLLAALAMRRKKISWNRGNSMQRAPRAVVLSSAIRWAIWLLECLIEQGSWNLPTLVSGNSGMSEAWHMVITGKYWPLINTMANGKAVDESSLRIFEEQIWEADADQIADLTLDRALEKWQSSGQRAREMVGELIDRMSILDCRIEADAEPDATIPSWPYPFAINLVRAVVALFAEIPSWTGEGFNRFQWHCGAASVLRKTILGSAEARGSNELEIEAQSASLEHARQGYPPPYEMTGFELRREVDPGLDIHSISRDVSEGIMRRWETYERVVSRITPASQLRIPKRFCAPISFQRPREEWREIYPPYPALTVESDTRRWGLPWEQVHYVSSVILALQIARADFGDGTLFDRAVGSIDVSGIEIGHATWPYVSGINYLISGRMDLAFTAHAGESFERSSTGLRTVGQLFLGSRAPDRIGHASSLDARMRRMIVKQQLHTVGSPASYRFDDYLQDLCFLSVVHSSLNVGDQGEHDLIRQLTSSAGLVIEPAAWVLAFEWIHTKAPLEFAVNALRSGLPLHERESSVALWRSLNIAGNLSAKLAVQQFLFGEIVDKDMSGRTPTAAINGVPADLEKRLIEFLESSTDTLEEWVFSQIRLHETLIECCPTSNLAIAGVREYEDHPVWRFLNMGVRVSVNSDDPLVFGGFAGEELAALNAGYGSDTGLLENKLQQLSTGDGYHAVVPDVDKDFLHRIKNLREAR